jgi:hypothetical protein
VRLSQLAPLLAFLAVAAIVPRPLSAAPVAGKIGLGVDTGDLLDSVAEGTLIVGKSERTAWLLLVRASASNTDSNDDVVGYGPDTLFTRDRYYDFYSIEVGPGLRRYVRSSGALTGYVDGTAELVRSRGKTRESNYYGPFAYESTLSSWGGVLGMALGVEYFFDRWPVSIAAHTQLWSVAYTSSKRASGVKLEGDVAGTRDDWKVRVGLGPRIQVRAYF